jgi:hypothetical protein
VIRVGRGGDRWGGSQRDKQSERLRLLYCERMPRCSGGTTKRFSHKRVSSITTTLR